MPVTGNNDPPSRPTSSGLPPWPSALEIAVHSLVHSGEWSGPASTLFGVTAGRAKVVARVLGRCGATQCLAVDTNDDGVADALIVRSPDYVLEVPRSL